MRSLLLFILFTGTILTARAQQNISFTSSEAEQVVRGNYDPATYQAGTVISEPDALVQGINARVSPDSLKKYIIRMGDFYNRNTGSDTLSDTRGIGAARRWAYRKFQEFSKASEGRLIPSYLYFEQDICSMDKHKNILAVLPGADKSRPIIVIEGHIDSRCDKPCDIDCKAEGIEDNASGSALVMELARVMSRYTFDHTIVFMLTIGEEQGLMGANAFAAWAQKEDLKIKAVLNNDVTGGIICGKTSSEPSCPGLNDIDSTHVRIFSAGVFNSPHKGIARFVKLEYEEEVFPIAEVPMTINIMTPQDRTGRSGDHIPFSSRDYPAIRFTSANEHGDASNGAGYDDRQHTSNDSLGIDTDGNGTIDSFFVDFNYLSRNAVINGMTAALLSQGPQDVPSFTMKSDQENILDVTIIDPENYGHYRIGLRTTSFEWDSVYTLQGSKTLTINAPPAQYHFVSVAVVDGNGIESVFSEEQYVKGVPSGMKDEAQEQNSNFELLQNKPNPFDEATAIGVMVKEVRPGMKSWIVINDIQGREIQKIPLQLKTGLNEVIYNHGYGVNGIYSYTLFIDGQAVNTKRMIFAY